MDDDLKQVLDAIREENAAAHAETRRRFEAAQVENAAAHTETRQLFESTQIENAAAHAETRRLFEAAQVENAAAHTETRRRFEAAQVENTAAHAETRRQMGALAEAHQYKLDLVIERVLSNGEKIDQLDAKFGQITSDLDTRVTRLEVASSRRRRI